MRERRGGGWMQGWGDRGDAGRYSKNVQDRMMGGTTWAGWKWHGFAGKRWSVARENGTGSVVPGTDLTKRVFQGGWARGERSTRPQGSASMVVGRKNKKCE